MEIKLLPLVGSFAENKDRAREIRLTKIIPALEKKHPDFGPFRGQRDDRGLIPVFDGREPDHH